MNDDAEDPILDACLDELLGGQTPPDLRDRILQRHRQLAAELLPPESCETQPQVAPERAGEQENLPRVTPAAANSIRKQASPTSWPIALATVAILLAVAFLGFHFLNRGPASSGQPAPPLAEVDEKLPHEAALSTVPSESDTPSEELAIDRPLPRLPEFPPLPNDPVEPSPQAPAELVRRSGDEMVSLINRQIRDEWIASGVTPAGKVADRVWCDRVFRRVTGRSPAAHEIDAFLAIDADERRGELVRHLFTETDHVAEFATHFATHFADQFLRSAVARDRGEPTALRDYLATEIRQSGSLAEIARQLLTAVRQPDQADPLGPAVFLLAHYDRDAKTIAASSAQHFWGRQLMCAECHDHPTDPLLTQRSFWEWNAGFRQLSVRRQRPENDWVLRDIDFKSPNGGTDAAVFFETPTGQLKAAYPSLPGQPELTHSGLTRDVNRRALFTKAMIESDQFRETMANHVWQFLLGFGFTVPIDDIGPHNMPSHPQLLSELGTQLAAHEFQLQSLVEWIVLSEPFGLQAGELEAGLIDTPELGSKPLFSRHYEESPAGLSVVKSLAALDAAQGRSRPQLGTTARVQPSFPLEGRGAATDGLLSPTEALTIDPRFERSFHSGPGPIVKQILGAEMPYSQKIEHLFLAILARPPQRAELQQIDKVLADRTDQRRALVDIWWALLSADE